MRVTDGEFLACFRFTLFSFEKYKYTDVRGGADMHFIAYMREGCARIESDGVTVEVKTGDFLYIPKGCRYQSFWYGSPDITFTSLGFSHFPAKGRFMLSAFSFDEAVPLLEAVGTGEATCASVAALYTLAAKLSERLTPADGARGSELVNRVVRLFSSEPMMSVAEAASRCGVSESTLYLAFRKHAGATPSGARREALARHAHELLYSTDLPVELISEKLGFSSPSYFRKIYKKLYGVCPRKTRADRRI